MKILEYRTSAKKKSESLSVNNAKQKQNLVKQLIPEFGQEVIIKSLNDTFVPLEGKGVGDIQDFSLEIIMNSINKAVNKLDQDFEREIQKLSKVENDENINSENISDINTIKQTKREIDQYHKKLQNLKIMFEVELQNKFVLSQQCNSNACKFEKQLQRQLAMKLSREEKLSLAVYQERYIQEYIKEKYQVIKANNENLKHQLLGVYSDNEHDDCSHDIAQHSKVSIVPENLTMTLSFLPRLKARTDNFQSQLVGISTEIQSNLQEVANLMIQHFQCLRITTFDSQELICKLDDRIKVPKNLTSNKLKLSQQDPILIIMKVFNRLTQNDNESAEQFLRNIYFEVKKAVHGKDQKVEAKIDFTEKIHQLYNLIQGYETKFSKDLTQKLEQIENSLEKFDLTENVDKTMCKLLYCELYKKIPFVRSIHGQNAEYYYYKFNQILKSKG